jgi:hypothetical protein
MSIATRAAIALALANASICLVADRASAKSGSNVIEQSRVANADIGRCDASKQGQDLIDCIGNAMAKFSTNVDRGEAPTRAPQIITMTRQAAGIRGKPKAEALETLRKLVSIARGLATKGASDFQPAYSVVAGVFARAVSVIEKK